MSAVPAATENATVETARHVAALLSAGSMMPDYTASTLEGKDVSLSAFRGHVVLLNFWATWCPPCVAEMPDLERLYREFKAEGLVILAVSIDVEGQKVVAPFWEKTGLTFPSLLDPSREVATRYGAWALPTSFLINPEGEVIARIPGPREWHSDKARAVFKNLLQQANHRESRQ